MSLWRFRGTIARSVAGDLPPPAERSLRDHLRGCAACRGYYDQLARVSEALAPETARRREQARLLAALTGAAPLATAPSPSSSPSSAGAWRWLRWSPLVLAPAVALLLLIRPATPPELDGGLHPGERLPPGEITWRGSPETSSAGLGLLVYAGRRSDGGVAPVRLVADLPGSGEGRLSLDDYVQFSVRGLRQPAYVTVVGLDQAGQVHVYAPRPDTAPRPLPADAGPHVVGPSIALSVKHQVGRLRLFAIATPAPPNATDVAAAVKRAGFSDALALPGTHATGLLAITP